jgi:hypothetical protein
MVDSPVASFIPRRQASMARRVPHGGLPAKREVHWLRVLADTWVKADVPEAKADVLHAP